MKNSTTVGGKSLMLLGVVLLLAGMLLLASPIAAGEIVIMAVAAVLVLTGIAQVIQSLRSAPPGERKDWMTCAIPVSTSTAATAMITISPAAIGEANRSSPANSKTTPSNINDLPPIVVLFFMKPLSRRFFSVRSSQV